MQTLGGVVGFLYLMIVACLALYGLHNLVTTLLYLRAKKGKRQNRRPGAPDNWPPVTIQLPIFNEKYTVERLLGAILTPQKQPW